MQDTKYKEISEFADDCAEKCQEARHKAVLDAFSNKFTGVDERFDKEFVETCDIWDCYNDSPSPQTVNRIKDFLHTELDKAVSEALEKQREDMLEKLPKFKFPELTKYLDMVEKARDKGKYDDMYENGFNECLSEIKFLLSNKIK